MIKLWGRRSSSNVQAVLWCLAELELEWDRVDAGYIYGVVDTDEYREMNPNGTVPTLQDGRAEPLWESGAILRYLASQYADGDFWPGDQQARSHVDKWAEWSKINIAGKFTGPIFWQVVRIPEHRRDPVLIQTGLEKLTHYLNIADRQLASNTYIAGNVLTLADIQFGHCLYRYFDIDIERKTLTNLSRYYEQLCARPHFVSSVMVDYSELIDSL